jgi:hypothetical protein
MKFYLAGPVGYGTPGINWKKKIKHDLRTAGHEVYDPIENDVHYALVEAMNKMKKQPMLYHIEIKEIMQEIFIDDCKFIANCDYVICYFVGKSYGTISEQGIAHFANVFLGKKVRSICIFEDFIPDEWLLCCADYIFFSLSEAKEFLGRFCNETLCSSC